MENETGRFAELAEVAIIAAFFTLALFLGVASASNHSIRHDYPVGYGASDSYQHQSRAEAIKNMGQYKNEAPYMVVGLKDVVGFYPPVLYHITVLFSNMSGMETYDALFLIMGLALALGALVAYYLAKNLGRAVAFLSLPLTLFMTTGAPFLGIVTFGQMPSGFSSFFLVATALAITKLDLPNGYFLAAILLAGTIMTHTSETLFFVILITALFAAMAASKVIRQKLSGIKSVLAENRKFLIAIILAMIPTLYFWPMFIGIWLKMQPYRFTVETVSASFPPATVLPTQFGFMFWAIVAGIVTAVLFLLQAKKESVSLIQSPKQFTMIFSIYTLLAGFGTYIGFGLRAFQLRLFWPITLAPLAGLGLYYILKLALKAVKKEKSILAVAIISTAALSIAILLLYYKTPSPGSMNPYHWGAMRWVAENTPPEAKVYVLYSDIYSQTSVLYNTERVSYFLDLPTFIDAIKNYANNGSFSRKMLVTFASDSGAGFPYRIGFLKFGQHIKDAHTSGVVDICGSDYYLVDKSMPQQVLVQANSYLFQKFIKANMTVAYDNAAVMILKNNNIGGDCLA